MPRRRRIAVIAILLLLLPVLWTIWLLIAMNRMDAANDALRAQGIEFTDPRLMPPAIPNSQNAFPDFQAALQAMNHNVACPRSSNMYYHEFPPYPPNWQAMTDAAVAANVQTLGLIHKAGQFPDVQWPAALSANSLLAVNLINPGRDLANLLADAAMSDHLAGDDARAVSRILDLFALAKIESSDPSLVGELIGNSLESTGLDELNFISAQPGVHPAARSQIQSLIAALLDDKPNLQFSRRGIAGDYLVEWRLASNLGDDHILLRPLFYLEAARWASIYAIEMKAAGQPDLASARVADAAIAGYLPVLSTGDVPRYSRPLTVYAMSLDRYFNLVWFHIADRHATAVLLAAELYHADQNQWPTSLQALVPHYLPYVPTDPLLAGSRPIGYLLQRGGLPSGGDRPLVYFGTFAAPSPPTQPCYSGTSINAVQWRDLSHF